MFRKRYVAFLDELSKLAKKHDELTDTDVRERLHEVVNYHFVWGKPMTGFPKRFAMMSASADRALAAIVKKFVVDARKFAEAEAVKAGAPRHALLEDPKARSRRGETYDVFLGSSETVQRAKKPAADSIYAKAAKKKKHRPNYPIAAMAVRIRGKKIVPTFDPESGMYNYEYRDRMVGLLQDWYKAAALREKARAELLEKD